MKVWRKEEHRWYHNVGNEVAWDDRPSLVIRDSKSRADLPDEDEWYDLPESLIDTILNQRLMLTNLFVAAETAVKRDYVTSSLRAQAANAKAMLVRTEAISD